MEQLRIFMSQWFLRDATVKLATKGWRFYTYLILFSLLAGLILAAVRKFFGADGLQLIVIGLFVPYALKLSAFLCWRGARK